MQRSAALHLPLLVALLAACSHTNNAHVAIPEPDVHVLQTSRVAEAARHMSGGIPMRFFVQVKNVADFEITLQRIDLQSMGYGGYDISQTSRAFGERIAPGATKEVEFWAAATVSQPSLVGANGPVTLRVISQFDSPSGAFQKTFVQQVNERP
jgi:hypothetical protein